MGWGSAGSGDGGGEPLGEPGAHGEGSWGCPCPLPCPATMAARMCSLSQVAMNDLSPAGPIQAVEILMESPSLADMCRMHHAVIRRIQVRLAAVAGLCYRPQQTWSWGAGGTLSEPKPRGRSLGVQLGARGGFLWHHHVAENPARPGCWQGSGGGLSQTSLPSQTPASSLGVWDMDSAPGMGPGQFGSETDWGPCGTVGAGSLPGGALAPASAVPGLGGAGQRSYQVGELPPARGRARGCPGLGAASAGSPGTHPSRAPLPAGAGAGAGGAGLGAPRPPHAVPAPDPGQPRGEREPAMGAMAAPQHALAPSSWGWGPPAAALS